MANITFEGQGPFEVALQKEPELRAQDDSVVLTLPVFAPGLPQRIAEIRLAMSYDHAKKIQAQLVPAIRLVEFHLKQFR
jgi:hypothetical protein